MLYILLKKRDIFGLFQISPQTLIIPKTNDGVMAEKGETKIMAIITICVILLSISFSGCVGDDENEEEYSFDLKFQPDSIINNNYLIIPFPINNNVFNEKIKQEFDKKKIEYIIESTIYGNGMNISFQTNIDISIKGKPNIEMVHDELSLINGTILFHKGNYWIYSTINGTINYAYNVKAGSNDLSYRLSTKLIKGWHLIEFTVWDVEVD
jgi:hypothetical protein